MGIRITNISKSESNKGRRIVICYVKDNQGIEDTTIYDYMAVMKKECDISYDILEVYEKQNGKIRIGPKWGINSLTGKPRKRDESA